MCITLVDLIISGPARWPGPTRLGKVRDAPTNMHVRPKPKLGPKKPVLARKTQQN